MQWMNQIIFSMRISFFLGCFLILLIPSCKETIEEDVKTNSAIPSKSDEFDGIEVLFNDDKFGDENAIELLKEINICSDVQMDANGNLVSPCTPENFKFFPLKEGKAIKDGFILLIKANTGGVPLRRVLVFERENGTLVKLNGFIANLIGKKKNKDTNDDLLLRFIDKIEGSDVYYHCIFKWENGKYVFKTVEVIQEPAGNFSGIVKENVKDSVSNEILKILNENQMIF